MAANLFDLSPVFLIYFLQSFVKRFNDTQMLVDALEGVNKLIGSVLSTFPTTAAVITHFFFFFLLVLL